MSASGTQMGADMEAVVKHRIIIIVLWQTRTAPSPHTSDCLRVYTFAMLMHWPTSVHWSRAAFVYLDKEEGR